MLPTVIINLDSFTPNIKRINLKCEITSDYIFAVQVKAIQQNGEEENGDFSTNFIELLKREDVNAPFVVYENLNLVDEDKKMLKDQIARFALIATLYLFNEN